MTVADGLLRELVVSNFIQVSNILYTAHYHVAAVLLSFHSKQCNQTEAGRENSLVSFYVMRISTVIVNGYTGNMTDDRIILEVYCSSFRRAFLSVESLFNHSPRSRLVVCAWVYHQFSVQFSICLCDFTQKANQMYEKK